MSILNMFVICFLFTSIVVTIVYFVAFRKPVRDSPQEKAVWECRTDRAFLGIQANPRMGKRKTDYLIFYDPKEECREWLNIGLDGDNSLNKQRTQNGVPLIKFSSWVGLILLFSFIIILAVKTGDWLFQIYRWLL